MGGDSVPGEVTLFQDAFSHFDKTKCGMLSTKMLGQLLRFVGENPSDSEVQVCQNSVFVVFIQNILCDKILLVQFPQPKGVLTNLLALGLQLPSGACPRVGRTNILTKSANTPTD